MVEKFIVRALDYIKNQVDDVVLRQIEPGCSFILRFASLRASFLDSVWPPQIKYADAAKFVVTALLMSDQGHLLSETDENLTISVMDRFLATSELGADAFWASLHAHFSSGRTEFRMLFTSPLDY